MITESTSLVFNDCLPVCDIKTLSQPGVANYRTGPQTLASRFPAKGRYSGCANVGQQAFPARNLSRPKHLTDVLNHECYLGIDCALLLQSSMFDVQVQGWILGVMETLGLASSADLVLYYWLASQSVT